MEASSCCENFLFSGRLTNFGLRPALSLSLAIHKELFVVESTNIKGLWRNPWMIWMFTIQLSSHVMDYHENLDDFHPMPELLWIHQSTAIGWIDKVLFRHGDVIFHHPDGINYSICMELEVWYFSIINFYCGIQNDSPKVPYQTFRFGQAHSIIIAEGTMSSRVVVMMLDFLAISRNQATGFKGFLDIIKKLFTDFCFGHSKLPEL